MSFDEKIFQVGFNAIRSFLGKKTTKHSEEIQSVFLADVSPRLRILASVAAGRLIEVKEAETIGGAMGDTIFLPRAMSLTANYELNRKAYLYRVVYSVMLSQMKIRLSEEHRRDSYAQALMSLLVAPLVRKELMVIYPGFVDLEKDLCIAESNRLSQIVSGSPRFLALHSLAISLVSGDSVGWAKEVLSSIPKSVDSIPMVVRELLSKLTFFSRTREDPTVLVPLIWGLVLPRNQITSGEDFFKAAVPTNQENGLSTGTEKKGKPRENIEQIKLSENKETENPLVHVFEKVKTVDDYVGGKKMLDGSDELEEQLEAIQELDLRKIIRSRERTESVYKVDVVIDSDVSDFNQDALSVQPDFIYDEWDFKSRKYKKNWCSVFKETHASQMIPECSDRAVADIFKKNAKQIRELRREFDSFVYTKKWNSRQPDGPEIDLDAVLDHKAALKAGHSSGGNFLYLSQRPKERDYATLILLDSSLSTDSWVQNRRVMDVMKESMLVLGKVVTEFNDRIAMGAFYSNTRNDCRYIEIKRFDENWNHSQAKLMGLRPTGYTRIGPALRHGTHLLNQMKAKRKLMLLMSDGKPTDYDRYEGRYGIEDIRQAIREASKENITVRVLAIESQAKFYLPQMFGVGNFQILPKPELLASSLAQLYGWLSVRR